MSENDFHLDPKLDADTILLTEWPLSRVLLMKDAAWVWLILVPRVENAIEITDLTQQQRQILMDEMAAAASCLQATVPNDKINIGALGNLVPQLHVHVIARRKGDDAWPAPVWGSQPATPYAGEELSNMRDILAKPLAEHQFDGI